MRLAALYAVLDCSSLIVPSHLLGAMALWDYSLASCRFLFGDALGNPVADAILTELRRKRDGITRTEIYSDLFHRNKPEGDIIRALGVLARAGLARSTRQAVGKGRPIERWFAVSNAYAQNAFNALNPAVK